MSIFKNKYILLLIFLMLGAAFIRLYRSYDLAVFLADQASDSTAVLHLMRGQFTLLGPITSVGGFFNGPIVYYLMFPFYILFKGNPYAGTFFQSFFSVVTIPVIYLLGKRLKNEGVGLIAAFLFAISPLMVDYARAAFNSYPAIFFSTLILYVFITLQESFSLKRALLLGILLGMIIQMHYLSLSLVLIVFIYPFIHRKYSYQLLNPRYYTCLILGMGLGLAPFILFELRHQFLNTHLFLAYLHKPIALSRSLVYGISIWPDVMGKLLFGNTILLGILGSLLTIATVVRNRTTLLKNNVFSTISLSFLIMVLFNALYGRELQTHYIVVFHTPLILLFAYAIHMLFKTKPVLFGSVLVIILMLNLSHWNYGFLRHPLQKGLGIAEFKYAASLIATDATGSYNVGMHAQGDNRAMPLRYMLALLGKYPAEYTNYASIDTLYFIVKNTEHPSQLRMWEYTSFGRSKVEKQWRVSDMYTLYRLAKVR